MNFLKQNQAEIFKNGGRLFLSWLGIYLIPFSISSAYFDLDFKQRLLYESGGYSSAVINLKTEF